jgi:hypothetical protein
MEDDPSLRHHGLTTCVKDFETIGYQVAHALIGDISIARTTRGYLKPSALVLRRRSTR